jgi:hypothetical protein
MIKLERVYQEPEKSEEIKELEKQIREQVEAQNAAHELGKPCEDEECQDCCGEFTGHEHDSSEGGYCLNCGHHPNA